GKAATTATDVYALGVVAYEALSGKKARPETNPVALAHAIVSRPAPDLREVWPGAPAEAAELLMRAMAADPSVRPRSATDLMRRLREALERPSTVPFTLPPTEPTVAPPPAVVTASRLSEQAEAAEASHAPASRAPASGATASPATASRATASPQGAAPAAPVP